MPGFLRNLLLIVLVCALVFNVGCASSLTPCTDSGGACVSDTGGPDGGLAHVSDGGKIAVYALVGLLITFSFALDLLILAATHDSPFPCCRAVVSICH